MHGRVPALVTMATSLGHLRETQCFCLLRPAAGPVKALLFGSNASPSATRMAHPSSPSASGRGRWAREAQAGQGGQLTPGPRE